MFTYESDLFKFNPFIVPHMKGFIHIPQSIAHKMCRHCGGAPVIVSDGKGGYIIRCLADENHYQTKPGLIDIDDWNFYNTPISDNEAQSA